MENESKKKLLPLNKDQHKYPYCIIWTTLPFITTFVPFLGHVGISTSQGVIRDFPDSFVVCEDNLAYGPPKKIWKLDPNKTSGDWDAAIAVTASVYKKRKFHYLYQNCYSMVVYALNEMNYADKRWDGVHLCLGTLIYGRFVNISAAIKTYAPFLTYFIFVPTLLLYIIYA